MSKVFSKFLESGLVAAVVMGVAYLLTYFNMAGMWAAYDLPSYLVDIGIPDIIETIYEVAINAWSLVPMVFVVCWLVAKLKNKELIRNIYVTTAIAGIILFTVVVLGRFLTINWILVGILVFMWGRRAVLLAVKQRDVKGIRAKWCAQFPNEKGTESARALTTVATVCLVVCGLYYACQTMYYYGIEDTQSEEWHYLARDHDNMVVVQNAGFNYVMVEYDGDCLGHNYEFASTFDVGRLEYVNTGVLEVRDAQMT